MPKKPDQEPRRARHISLPPKEKYLVPGSPAHKARELEKKQQLDGLVRPIITAAGIDEGSIINEYGRDHLEASDILFNIRHTTDPRIAIRLVREYYSFTQTPSQSAIDRKTEQLKAAGLEPAEWVFYSGTTKNPSKRGEIINREDTTKAERESYFGFSGEIFPHGTQFVLVAGLEFGSVGNEQSSHYGWSSDYTNTDSDSVFVRVNPEWTPPAEETE